MGTHIPPAEPRDSIFAAETKVAPTIGVCRRPLAAWQRRNGNVVSHASLISAFASMIVDFAGGDVRERKFAAPDMCKVVLAGT